MKFKEYAKAFWNDKKLRNTTFVVVIILIVIIGVGSYKGYTYAEKYLERMDKDKQKEIELIIKQRDSLKTTYLHEIDSIKNIQTDIDNYYYEYINERNKANALQKRINALSNMFYSKHKLDSIAEHVRYK